MCVVQGWISSFSRRLILQPLAALVGNFPDAVLRFLHAAIFVRSTRSGFPSSFINHPSTFLRESIFLEAAVGFFGDGHFEKTRG